MAQEPTLQLCELDERALVLAREILDLSFWPNLTLERQFSKSYVVIPHDLCSAMPGPSGPLWSKLSRRVNRREREACFDSFAALILTAGATSGDCLMMRSAVERSAEKPPPAAAVAVEHPDRQTYLVNPSIDNDDLIELLDYGLQEWAGGAVVVKANYQMLLSNFELGLYPEVEGVEAFICQAFDAESFMLCCHDNLRWLRLFSLIRPRQ